MSARDHHRFISVKFDPVGRVHTFLLPEFALDPPPVAGEALVVPNKESPACATVVPTVQPIAERRTARLPEASAATVRRATDEDIVLRLKQQGREQEARQVCAMKIRERNLPMKLAKVEQLFDGSKLIFYFTAEGRVDFRELVRELAAEFKTRIEMRQIGVRDEAKVLGGYGSCGRPLCCTTWLHSFEPVSIKMAKQQHLSLNPSRLSGLCGRLKCCLRYELPNAKGQQFAGCAHDGQCSSTGAGGCRGGGGSGGCGSGACGAGGCGACGGDWVE